MWGADEELDAANLITPLKRKQALAIWRPSESWSMSGFAWRHDSSLYGPLEPALSRRRCVLYKTTRRVLHRRRWSERPRPPEITIPLHHLALVAMGVSIFDNLDFEGAIEQARRMNRYEFRSWLRRCGSIKEQVRHSIRLRFSELHKRDFLCASGCNLFAGEQGGAREESLVAGPFVAEIIHELEAPSL